MNNLSYYNFEFFKVIGKNIIEKNENIIYKNLIKNYKNINTKLIDFCKIFNPKIRFFFVDNYVALKFKSNSIYSELFITQIPMKDAYKFLNAVSSNIDYEWLEFEKHRIYKLSNWQEIRNYKKISKILEFKNV